MASDDGTVRVLAADGSGRPLILSGQTAPVLGVDMSPDGARVVSAGSDGTVRLWNLRDGGSEHVLHRGKRQESDVRFSPDGSLVVGAGFDGWVRLWNAATGAEKTRVRGDGNQQSAVAFSADGRRFSAGGVHGVIRVWNVSGSALVAVLRGQLSRVNDIGFGATNDRLVSAGDDGNVRTWDAGRTPSWVVPSPTDSVDFSLDGRLVVTGSEDGTVRVWDAASGELRESLPGAPGYTIARFSPTAREVTIARDARSSVFVWPLTGKAPKLVVQLAKGRGMYAARFDSTGRRIVYVDGKGAIAVRDLQSGRDTSLRGASEAVFDAQFSPDNDHLAAATRERQDPDLAAGSSRETAAHARWATAASCTALHTAVTAGS